MERTIGPIELRTRVPSTRSGGAASEATAAAARSAPDPRLSQPPAPPDLLANFGPLVIAVRWATVALGLGLAALGGRTLNFYDYEIRVWAFGVPLVAYSALRTLRPLRYITDRVTSLVMVFAEVGLCLSIVVATEYWASPYVFCLASAILAAGFARGFGFAIRTACAAIAAVAIPYHVSTEGARLLITVQWGVELLFIALVAGYARRLFGEVEEQNVIARQANDLLTQLNAVAQTLPASLDLEETVSTTIRELRELFPIDVVVVLLREEAGDAWSVTAAEGVRLRGVLVDDDLPVPARQALFAARPVLAEGSPGLSPESRAGIYLPLLARERLIGLLAVEGRTEGQFGPHQLQLGEGVAAQAALALDNARWFSRLRTVGADDERTRIARDLHDRVGQSLAYVSFELDRISRQAAGQLVHDDLLQLREEVRKVVTEVRDTLYDLRTDVSDRRDLVTTLADFLDRVGDRSGLETRFHHRADRRLAVRQERELWRIAQEAVTNAYRHARASVIEVTWLCEEGRAVLEVRDDGVGLPPGLATAGSARGLSAPPNSTGRSVLADAYGILGMRERAAAIGARLDLSSQPGAGTSVRCELSQ